MAVDFNKLLSKPADEVEKPKPAPMGTYDALIVDHEFGESSKKGTPFVQFNVRLVSPKEDVEEDELAEAGGMEKIGKRTMRDTFYLTEDAMWRLTDFLQETLGISGTGRTIAEMIPEAVNASLVVHINHRTSQDGSQTFAEIDDRAPAE